MQSSPISPTVTAIIPTYNRERFIGEAIDSVLAQTRAVQEVIVVDDGSTDKTEEVVSRYGEKVRYVRQANSGPGAARNRGMQEATGDLVAFLDSDDLWVPRKTELQLAFLERNPAQEFIFGDMANFSAEADNDEPEIKVPEMHRYFVEHAANLDELFDWLVQENVIPTPTVLMRRSCFERVGLFDQKLKIAEDLDYWLRVARNCRCGFVNAVLAKRRRHESNLINDWVGRTICHADVLIRAGSMRPELPDRSQRRIKARVLDLYYDLGSHFYKKGDYTSGYKYLREGVPSRLWDLKWVVKYAACGLKRTKVQ